MVAWAAQLAEALEVLDRLKIYHGDLRAPNILLSPHDHIIVADFGVGPCHVLIVIIIVFQSGCLDRTREEGHEAAAAAVGVWDRSPPMRALPGWMSPCIATTARPYRGSFGRRTTWSSKR